MGRTRYTEGKILEKMHPLDLKKIIERLEGDNIYYQKMLINNKQLYEKTLNDFNDYIDKLEEEIRQLKQPKQSDIQLFGLAELKKGRKGENTAFNYFKSAGYAIEDVSEDPFYQEQDIDFLVQKDDVSFSLEVKSSVSAADKRKLVIEDILNIRKGRLGWIHYCKADYLAVVSKNKMFMYKPQEMREYLELVKAQNKEMEASTEQDYDLFNGTVNLDIDLNITAEKRQLEDPKFRKSVSEIYYVEIEKYMNTGRELIEIDLA